MNNYPVNMMTNNVSMYPTYNPYNNYNQFNQPVYGQYPLNQMNFIQPGVYPSTSVNTDVNYGNLNNLNTNNNNNNNQRKSTPFDF